MTVENKTQASGWGHENYPNPPGVAFIETDEMKCVGCEICQMACSMQHFGVINKDLARIQVHKYLLPAPKAVQVVCSQCQKEERECEKACPVDPPAIHYDEKTFHMVLDKERCLGQGCLLCFEACPSKAIVNYPRVSESPLVCDLCDTENTGKRNPQCVNVCPTGALYYKDLVVWGFPLRDMVRKHADEKAALIARRLYPLTKDKVWQPAWRSQDE
ncbi:MAG: 4Fe-4S dicluster domain-containing protein [Chloroflexi bacterium]|nr:4Fe-4S dicluster domain-containing protein [Chloroflexota bacterium]